MASQTSWAEVKPGRYVHILKHGPKRQQEVMGAIVLFPPQILESPYTIAVSPLKIQINA
jgi:hypothetical protein